MTGDELRMVEAVAKHAGRPPFNWSESWDIKAHSLRLPERLALYRAVLAIGAEPHLCELAREKLDRLRAKGKAFRVK
jgi:hypothetical protein